MKFSMTGQEKSDLLILVTSYTGLIIYIAHIFLIVFPNKNHELEISRFNSL